MDPQEVSLRSSQEAASSSSSSNHQNHQQGSASGSRGDQAEAQVHSPEPGYDSDLQYMETASAQETSQVDHNPGDQSPRQTVEMPHVLETSNRRLRARQERRHREGSRVYRLEGRIYDGDRSRSPPLDRLRSGSARSFRIRDERRHSHGYRSGDDFSGTNLRFIRQLLLMFDQAVNVQPYFDGEKVFAIPKGFKISFNQKSTTLTPIGKQK